jgi:hypothetical protein
MDGCFVDVTEHLHYAQVPGGVTSVVWSSAAPTWWPS